MGFSLSSFLGGKGASFSNLTPGGVLDDLMGRRNMEEQNKYNLQMWNLQNQYNSPKAQMERFAEAGLNPNLIYTQGNAGNASPVAASASAGGLSQALGSVSKAFSTVMAAKSIVADIKNKQAMNNNLLAQNSLIDSQVEVARAQARKQILENNFFEKNQQWPSVEGGYAKNTKSLLNYLGDLFNFKANKLRFNGGQRIERYDTMDGRYVPIRY